VEDMWLNGIIFGCRTNNQEVVSLNPGLIAIEWLLLEWMAFTDR